MARIHPEFLEHQRKRFMRQDAPRYIRPDAYRFVRPGHEHLLPPEYWERYGPARPHEPTRNFVSASIWRRGEPRSETPAADDPRSFEAQVRELRCELAALRFRLALEKFAELCAKAGYDPTQPRIPAGNPDGGQWTDVPRWSGRNNRTDNPNVDPEASLVLSDVAPDDFFKPGAHLAQNDTLPSFSVDLHEERRSGGHTIDKHVNKTAEALIAQSREAFQSNPRAQDSRSGSFSSLESATKLVNSTLAQNQAIVEEVAMGIRSHAVVFSKFKSVTGVEAVAPNIRSQPYIRETYGVGVVIVHDRSSPKGYTVWTAFPSNR